MNQTQHKVIVSKFGGSSMKDAQAIRRSANIAKEKNSSVVVVSATYGTTNQLIELAQTARLKEWSESEKVITDLKEKHRSIAKELGADSDTFDHIESLLSELETLAKGINYLKDAPKKAMDRLQSLGERLSSPLMTVALREIVKEKPVSNFDVRQVMRTNDDFGKGIPQIEEIRALCGKHMLAAKIGDGVFVTQGFVGATKEGETTTLGRGGSDYSAALLAEGIGADLLEIWTDVAGIATTDPRLCSGALPIGEITFQEAAELAIFGAKILHPTTLAPVQRVSIPVFVGSSYEPDAPGTWIKAQSEHQPLVRAMALRKDQALLTLTTPKMLNSFGFLSRLFGLFEKHKVSIDAITTSEISVAVTVEEETLSNQELFKDLETICTVQMEKGLSLVSLIGNNINHTAGLAQRIFTSISNQENEPPINVRMICLGASRHNFCLVVKSEEAGGAIKRLHKTFIEEAQ
ncbi:MAG: lysine-sensitive aspartokinase 3 [Bdellovibrionota bacterium]|nr:lysine-sensitive aspartokinase 3 [Bdellovibrionota bacterium]